MRLEPGCPVEIRTIIACAGGAEAVLFNRGTRRVRALEGVTRWRREDGRSLACVISHDRLRAGGGEFRLCLTCPDPAAACTGLYLTRVRFEDGVQDWRAGSGPAAEPVPACVSPDRTPEEAVAAPPQTAARDGAAEEPRKWRRPAAIIRRTAALLTRTR